MTKHEDLARTLSHVDPEHIYRCLAIANHLLTQVPDRHGLTPHDVVQRAYDEILDGVHDADYHPTNLIVFFGVVMTRIVLAARKKTVREAGWV